MKLSSNEKFSVKCVAMAAFFTLAGNVCAQEVVRIGMTPEPYMPFTRITASGAWEGIEADISRSLCEKMPVECVFEQMAWEGLMPSLLAGKVDAVIGAFTITPERKKTVSFTLPYYTESTVLVGQKTDTKKIGLIEADDGNGDAIDAQALQGSIIGVQVASTQYNYTQKYLPNIEVKSYDTADNAMADLMAGRVDYVLAAELFIKEYIGQQKNDDLEIKTPSIKNKLLGEGIAYALSLSDEKNLKYMNEAIEQLQAEGLLQEIAAKWVE